MNTELFDRNQPPSDVEVQEFLAVGEPGLLVRVRNIQVSRPHRRKRRFIAGGLAVVVIGTGGVAYANGALPDVFSSAMDRAVKLQAQDSHRPVTRPSMVQIVDMTMPDGSRFAAWRGRSATLECTANIDNWDGHEAPDGGGSITCVAPDGRHPDDNRFELAWPGKTDDANKDSVPDRRYPVVFGDVAGKEVTRVHITGKLAQTGRSVDMTVPVDPTTRAFSALLPGSSANPWGGAMKFGPIGLRLSFLNDHGDQVRPSLELEEFH